MEAAALRQANLLARRTRRQHRSYTTCPWSRPMELDASAAFAKRLAKELHDGDAAAAKRATRGNLPPPAEANALQRSGDTSKLPPAPFVEKATTRQPPPTSKCYGQKWTASRAVVTSG